MCNMLYPQTPFLTKLVINCSTFSRLNPKDLGSHVVHKPVILSLSKICKCALCSVVFHQMLFSKNNLSHTITM